MTPRPLAAGNMLALEAAATPTALLPPAPAGVGEVTFPHRVLLWPGMWRQRKPGSPWSFETTGGGREGQSNCARCHISAGKAGGATPSPGAGKRPGVGAWWPIPNLRPWASNLPLPVAVTIPEGGDNNRTSGWGGNRGNMPGSVATAQQTSTSVPFKHSQAGVKA